MLPNRNAAAGGAGSGGPRLAGRILGWLGADRPRGEPRRHFHAVILKVDRIGDFVLALGAIRLVLQERGEANCLLVVSPLVAPLATEEFPRTPQLILPAFVGRKRFLPEARRARRALGEVGCDVALTLRHQRWTFDELSLAWLHAQQVFVIEDAERRAMFAGRRAYVFPGGTRLAFPVQGPRGLPGGEACRELAMHRQLVAAVLARAVKAEEIVPVLDRGAGAPSGPVIIGPLGSHAGRDLPPEILAAIGQALAGCGCPALLTGSPEQRPRLQQLAASVLQGGPGEVGIRCDLSLPELVRAIAAAPLVVATETAAAHLATALDRPTVVIMGGGHFGQFGPWCRSARQIWLTEPMDCFGCNWRCIHPRPYCLTRIASERIAEAIRERIEPSRPSP